MPPRFRLPNLVPWEYAFGCIMSLRRIGCCVTSLVASLTVVLPPLAFQSAVVNSNSIEFAWSAPAGFVCQPQYSTNLASTNWLPPGAPQTAGSGVLSASDPTRGGSQRFYRILILPSD